MVFATAMAYTGVMVAWGCAVWGTGYYYPPYVWHGGMYPIYYPHYPIVRVRRVVQPLDRRLYTRRRGLRTVRRRGRRRSATTRARERTRAAPSPTVRTARAARRPPTTRAPAHTARPGRARTSTAAGARPASRAATSGRPRRDTRTTSREIPRATAQGSGGGEAIRRTGGPGGSTTVGRTGSGDVYAGHDGNVYRKQGDSWQQYGEGGWNSVDRPEPQAGETGRSGATATAERCGRPRHDDVHTKLGSRDGQSGRSRREGSQHGFSSARAMPEACGAGSTSSRAGSYRPRVRRWRRRPPHAKHSPMNVRVSVTRVPVSTDRATRLYRRAGRTERHY